MKDMILWRLVSRGWGGSGKPDKPSKPSKPSGMELVPSSSSSSSSNWQQGSGAEGSGSAMAADGTPAWAIADDAADKAEKGGALVLTSPNRPAPSGAGGGSPWSGPGSAAVRLAELEKKGMLSDAEWR